MNGNSVDWGERARKTLQRDCPKCPAQAGEPCEGRGGRPLILFHVQRNADGITSPLEYKWAVDRK